MKKNPGILISKPRLSESLDKVYKLVDATEKDKRKVLQFYQHHPVFGYEMASVHVIYNPSMNHKFALHLAELQQCDKNPAFEAKWPTGREKKEDRLESQEKIRWRAQVYEQFKGMAKPYQDSDYPSVYLLPMWHGTKADIVDSICRTGYANLAITDSGFLGKGIYGAYEAEYSYRVYAKQGGALILNWTAIFSAYPVIDGDMSKFVMKNSQGQAVSIGNYSNYDAHFAPVVPCDPTNPQEITYYPTKPNQRHTYTELVVFQKAACLPRYLVELKKVLQNSLPSSSQQIGGTTTTTNTTTITITTTTVTSTTASTSKSIGTSNGDKIGEKDLDYQAGRSLLSSGNYQKAVGHFEKSAEKKYPPAYLVLGFLYQAQFSDLIGKNESEKSVKYYQKAVSKLEWFQQAADSGLADAQTGLGFCYFHGIGVKQDKQTAVKYYQLAAEQGEISAMNNLARCYKNGDGVEIDLKKSAEFYQRSADAKDVNAQLNFALCCKYGDGVPQDDQKAFQYFILAADQGDAVAQYHTAVCFRDAQGTDQNLQQALKYFESSAHQNNQDAKNALSMLVQSHPELKATTQNFSPSFFPPDKTTSLQNTLNSDQKCVLQ